MNARNASSGVSRSSGFSTVPSGSSRVTSAGIPSSGAPATTGQSELPGTSMPASR